MKSTDHFFKRNTYFNVLFLCFVLILNTALLLVVSLSKHSRSHAFSQPIEEVTPCFSTSEDGELSVNLPRFEALLSNRMTYSMLLDKDGNVIWEFGMPEELPTHYDIKELLESSKKEFQHYPTSVYHIPQGLLVFRTIPSGLCFFHGFVKVDPPLHASGNSLLYDSVLLLILLNTLLSIFVYWYNNYRFKKLVQPILGGVENLIEDSHAPLPETGQLADIASTLNRVSNYIRQKNEARVKWINGISHDIRTPLSCILGYGIEIEEDSSLPEDTRTQAHVIRVQAEKLRRLVWNLNIVSQLEYSMQPLATSSVDPVELVRNLLVEFIESDLDGQYDFEFRNEIRSECLIEADSTLITRMLENIIQNSISHNPDGCKIRVVLRLKNQHCVFIISDNGKGVSPEKLKELNHHQFFEKIRSADGGADHGLGLRLIFEIASAHHGNVLFSAVHPHGLSLTVSLPLKAAAPSPEEKPQSIAH